MLDTCCIEKLFGRDVVHFLEAKGEVIPADTHAVGEISDLNMRGKVPHDVVVCLPGIHRCLVIIENAAGILLMVIIDKVR